MVPLPQAKLPRREREIMDALYQSGEATVNEVIERMPDPPSYSAVRATLRVLEDKGLVKHKQDGPRYVYLPAIPTSKAGFAALKHLVQTFFDGSAEQALVAARERVKVLERLKERAIAAHQQLHPRRAVFRRPGRRGCAPAGGWRA